MREMCESASRVHLEKISFRVLKPKTLQVLADGLNSKKIFLSPGCPGYPRDYRGLADLAKVQFECLGNEVNPTLKLFELWMQQRDKECSLSEFQNMLEVIDRFDLHDDTRELFFEDALSYLNRTECVLEDPEKKDEILTVHDSNLVKKTYDAFVMYVDKDTEFARKLIEELEGSGFQLCLKDRDLIGGSQKYDAILKLISERCNRLIVIISPAFLESSVNEYFVNFALSLQIERKMRKIIPCMEKFCLLPDNLKYLVALNFEQPVYFWTRLKASIRVSDQAIKTNLNNDIGREVAILQPQKDFGAKLSAKTGSKNRKSKKIETTV